MNKSRMFWLGTVFISIGAGARYGTHEAAAWFAIIGCILLVLS